MQQQPSRAFCAPLAPAKQEPQPCPQSVRNGPTELDLDKLAHVAGGDAAGMPKRIW